MKLEFSWQILEKYSTIEVHENPSSGSRVVPRGQTDERTDMTKLTVSFRNFGKASKNTTNLRFEVTEREQRTTHTAATVALCL